jgi:hypothetical protein
MVATRQSGDVTAAGRRKTRMDQLFEAFGSGIGNSIGWLADHWVLFGVFLVLWVAFGAGLVASQGSLDQAWQTISALPLPLQIVVWVLFLPVMIGMWIWEASGWNVIVRLVLVVSLAAWNLLMFLPRQGGAAPVA